MKSARKPTIYQQLINKFVVEEYKKDKYFWPREVKIAKDLINKYSQEFFEWLKLPFGYKANSLLYFLGKDGDNYLREQYFEYLKTKTDLSPKPTENFTIDNSPVLEDNIEIIKKPKTLQEFLK